MSTIFFLVIFLEVMPILFETNGTKGSFLVLIKMIFAKCLSSNVFQMIKMDYHDHQMRDQ